MDAAMGTVKGQQAQYRQLLDRLGKTISEIGTCLTTHEQRLEVVLERPAPSPEKNTSAPFMGGCPLEDDLRGLCDAAEMRLLKLQELGTRLRL